MALGLGSRVPSQGAESVKGPLVSRAGRELQPGWRGTPTENSGRGRGRLDIQASECQAVRFASDLPGVFFFLNDYNNCCYFYF